MPFSYWLDSDLQEHVLLQVACSSKSNALLKNSAIKDDFKFRVQCVIFPQLRNMLLLLKLALTGCQLFILGAIKNSFQSHMRIYEFYPGWTWPEHFPARMTLLICLLLSSLSVFTVIQVDSKGSRADPFGFFSPHRMHFKCFALLQMLCNLPYSKMCSPQHLALTTVLTRRKKVQLCCSESLYEEQPIQTDFIWVQGSFF